MKTPAIILLTVFGLLAVVAGVWLKPGTPKSTYTVQLKDDVIIFQGFDQPWLTDARPDDKYSVSPFNNGELVNDSRDTRCYAEAEKAFPELKKLAQKATVEILLRSLRTEPNPSGYVEYYISRDGNKILINELKTRGPISQELMNRFGDICPFDGANGPGLSLKDLLGIKDN